MSEKRNEGYKAEIIECSKQLTAKEKIMMKDTSNAIGLDEATKDGPILIAPDYYAIVHVHNELSDNKDYDKCVLIAKDGTKYATGSESFIRNMVDIMEEMEDSGEEYQLSVYRKDSNNYKGKQFITCSVV